MPRSRLVAVAPNPSIDRLVEVAAFRHGEIHRPLAATTVAGGKGFNVARVAAALGAEVTAIGPLAGHAGRWIAEALGAEGLEVSAVWTEGETRTCTSVLDRSDGSMTEIYEAGATIGVDDWRRLLETLRAALAPSGATDVALVTASGSLPPGVPDDGLEQIVRCASAAGFRIAVDGHGPALRRALAARPWLVKVNLDEARDALGEPAISPESAVRAMISAGARHAIVTSGREGAVMALEDGSLIRLKPPVQGIHTVGVGDAFLGGFAVGIMQGEDLRGAAVMGIATASASALVPGAGRIDVASVARLRSEVGVSSANRLDEL